MPFLLFYLLVIKVANNPPGQMQGVLVVDGVVIGDPGASAVEVGTAQLLGRDLLAGGGFHQRWSAEENCALSQRETKIELLVPFFGATTTCYADNSEKSYLYLDSKHYFPHLRDNSD